MEYFEVIKNSKNALRFNEEFFTSPDRGFETKGSSNLIKTRKQLQNRRALS